jgi:hypothetical protein
VQDAILTRPESPEIVEFGTIIDGGATLTALDNGYRLSIPQLRIDVVLPSNGSPVSVAAMNTALANIQGNLSLTVSHHTHFAGGFWIYQASDPRADSVLTPFIFGYRTPVNAIPNTGTATYAAAGGLAGIVFVRRPSGGVGVAELEGDISLTANFAQARLTGSATNVIARDEQNTTSSWNSFSVDAMITTAVSSTPATPFALKSGADGRIGGYFFGPNLDSVGAVWSLGNGDESGAAYGVIGAEK